MAEAGKPWGPLPTHGRFGYSAIHKRPALQWPGGARLAVYIGFNIEHFAFGEGLGANLGPASPQPDVLNYSWREYGNRVGVWRCLDLFDELALPTGAIVNTALYDHCPEVIEALVARGDELIAHGHTNAQRQGTMAVEDERALIVHCRERIARAHGKAPAGWLSPWISESAVTPDLLKEAGYGYTLNWCHDDQPTWLQTRAGPLCAVPYPQEVNDIPMIVGRLMDGKDFAQMVIDQFDEMLEQSRSQPLVMGIALHPYLVGQPYRLRHLRRALRHIADHRAVSGSGDVWLTTPGAIAEVAQAHAGAVS
ncbi:MAG: polysaccharide deacetylase family protein [Pseudomonadota bacterium]|nr:polysaccharide deacetylase family protein [Pseudomonadota bacterium]